MLKNYKIPFSEAEIKSHVKTIMNANEKLTNIVVSVNKMLVEACLNLL